MSTLDRGSAHDNGICRLHCSFNWLVFPVPGYQRQKHVGASPRVGLREAGRRGLGTKLSRLLNTRPLPWKARLSGLKEGGRPVVGGG